MIKRFAAVAATGIAATGVLAASPASAVTTNSGDLVKITAAPAFFIGTNTFNVTNNAWVNRDAAQRSTILPAGTRIIMNSSNLLNVALGDYKGYDLTLLTINGRKHVLVTLDRDYYPGESVKISLGQVQATLLTTFTARLDDYSNQPWQTKVALDATERLNNAQTQYNNNNRAGLSCFIAVAPLVSACTAVPYSEL